MKGRGYAPGEHQQGNRPRGFPGRGGRQSAPRYQGTIPSIGAYLDLPPGRDIVPGTVTNWMNKLSEYSMTQCTTKIGVIFGADGVLGAYPVFTEPADPLDTATPAVKKKWEIKFTAWSKIKDSFDLDKTKLFGIMLGQMSESSKTRARETTMGQEAMTEQEPRKLLQAILATHLGDSRLGAEHHLFNMQQRYHMLKMGPTDTLVYYHQSIRSTLLGIDQAYIRAGRVQPEGSMPEMQKELKFTMGLNHLYEEHKNFFINGVKPWPQSLDDAYTSATKYIPKQRQQGGANAAAERANAFVMRHGKGGGGNRGGGHESKSAPNAKFVRYDKADGEADSKHSAYVAAAAPSPGNKKFSKKGTCHNCGEPGHYSYACTEPVQYWKEDGATKSSPQTTWKSAVAAAKK